MPKFYITGLYRSEITPDRLPAIEIDAADRVDALLHLRCTVWTEEEFRASEDLLPSTTCGGTLV